MDWQRLIAALREETIIYSELLEMSGEKRDAIFQKNVDRLDAVVRREQGAAANLAHWEKQRLASMDAPASPSGSPALLFYAEQAPPEERKELLALHEELSEIIRKLQKANTENKALIESRLEYVRFALDVLTADQTSGVYSRPYADRAGYNPLPDKSMLDKKV